MMRHFRTALLLAFVAGALPTAPVSAQDNVPWRLSYFPYLTASPNDGVMGIARAIWFQQAGWGERVTLAQYVAVEAGYSTRDAWQASITYGAPRLTDDWRLMAHAEIGHQPRFGNPDLPVVRDRALAWVDVTRHLEGPLHFAVRGGLRREEIADGADVRKDTDATLRGAFVVDLRDREFEVNRGALLEGGVIVGNGGRKGYRALYTHLRGWYNPLQYLRLTGRFAWREPVSKGSIASTFEIPGWEGDVVAVGGYHSHRGLGEGQVSGSGLQIAGVEARFDVINIGEIGAVTLIGFADGGRALRHDDLTIPCEGVCPRNPALDWTWAAGGGVALRVLRAATLTITAARANHDTRWYVGSGWSW